MQVLGSPGFRAQLRRGGIAAAVTTTALVTAAAPALASPGTTGHASGHHAGQQGSAHQPAAHEQSAHQGSQAARQGSTVQPQGRQGADSQAATHGQSATRGKSSAHGQSAAHHAATHGTGAAPAAGSHGHSSASSSNPPGNNGTIKIHAAPGEDTHANQPHVTCDFWLDMYGFDGAQTGTIDFVGQAPTGAGTPLLHLAGVMLNPQSTRGNGATFDRELGFTTGTTAGLTRIDVTALGAPQPKQGYHVKVSVNADGAPGGAKQKVFWIAPCAAAPVTAPGGTGGTGPGTGSGSGSGSGTGSGTGTGSGSGTGGAVGATGTTSVAGTGAARAPIASGAQPAQVLGEKFTRASGTAATASSGALPFTGLPAGALAGGAAGALLAGGGLVLLARRRREDATG